MSSNGDGPRVLLDAKRFRVVRTVEGSKVTYVFEKNDGCDALGVERWRDLKFGEADAVSKMLRDWIIEHVAKQDKATHNERAG